MSRNTLHGLRFRRVQNHYVVVGSGTYNQYGIDPDRRLPTDATSIWNHAGLDEAEEAIVAYLNGVMVGFFRYTVYDDKVLYPAGTWVAPTLRRQGLAKALWAKALAKHKVQDVDGVTASPEGAALVEALRDEYSEIAFLFPESRCA